MKDAYYKQLEEIIRENLNQRGLGEIELEGELKAAAASLILGETILIVTGFVIRDAMTGETDGPIGAVSLAGALEQLGKKVVLITDGYSENILNSCRSAKWFMAPIEIISIGSEDLFCRRMLEKYEPTHMVAIERPGRTSDQRCYSMKGEDFSDIVPNTDILFEEAENRGIITIAVGDGGNEVGMGKIESLITELVHNGKQICAAVRTDYLVLAGVSNWGGHALAAALSVLTRIMLLHDAKTEEKLLKSIVEAGAVDGLSKKREMTVDGLSLEDNLRILNLLRNTVESSINRL